MLLQTQLLYSSIVCPKYRDTYRDIVTHMASGLDTQTIPVKDNTIAMQCDTVIASFKK